MIPVTLVTGFLGSGKTAHLRHRIAAGPQAGVLYIVNEFSPRDVDGSRLDLPEGQCVTVAGGSIFCRCKTTDFLAALRRGLEHDPSAVVVEASGIADPRVMPRMLRETQMDHAYRLAETIALVDPGSFAKLRHTLPNFTAQLQAADILLLNKSDLYPEETLQAVEDAIRTLRPEARILRTVYGAMPVAPPTHKADSVFMDGTYAKCRDPNFQHADLPLPDPVEWEELRHALDEPALHLYRVKGTVRTRGGGLSVDGSDSGWTAEPVADIPDAPGLVLIHAPAGAVAVESLLARWGMGGVEPHGA